MNNEKLLLYQTNFNFINDDRLIQSSVSSDLVNWVNPSSETISKNIDNELSQFQNANTDVDKYDLTSLKNLVNNNNASFCSLQNYEENSNNNTKQNHISQKINNKRKRKINIRNEIILLDSKTQFKRKNIKKIFSENKLSINTLNALEEEKKRQGRLTSNSFKDTNSLQNNDKFFSVNNIDQNNLNDLLKKENLKKIEKINLLDDSVSNNIVKLSEKPFQIIEDESPIFDEKSLVESKDDDIILLDEPDNKIENDDDDCLLISESERQQDDEARYKKKISGMHMNNDLNVPDANGQVLVNVNHPLEDEDVFLLPFISKNVKPHQIGGIRFIYDNIVESLSRVKVKDYGFGCILAHAMGLGKTLQTIAFVEVFLRCIGNKQRVLCIVPINTIQNWLSELNFWLPENGQQKIDNDTVINYDRPFKVYVINDLVKNMKQRIEIILKWKSNGGLLLIGYEMFRSLTTCKNIDNQIKGSKYKDKKCLSVHESIYLNTEEAKEVLLTPCLVVCDEGHRIKNSSANIAKTLQKIKTKRRIILTGYPLQNNLIEYWCMVDFVRPNYLGTKAEFSNMFERPIINGQCIDSTREDIKLMRFRSHVLHSLLEGFVQRRGHNVFFDSFPKKQEYVILLKLSDIQKKIYLAYIETIGSINQSEKSNPLRSFAMCCKIWNHPDVLYKFNQLKGNEIDLDIPELQQHQEKRNKNVKTNSKASNYKYIPLSNNIRHEFSGFNPFALSLKNDSNYKSANSNNDDWMKKILESYQTDILENGVKLNFSFTLIKESVLAGDKILLFSQSLLSLNLIEEYLQKINVPNRKEKWEKNKNYYRLDGSTSGSEREKYINSFNKTNNQIWLFLLSTRAGCLGINLIGANRVIVLDASWNPCHDSQAVCRVYRYGQNKNCYIYRLIADHTMEKKIYERQIGKQTMSDRVVDEIQTQNHFTRNEVENLIHYVKEEVPCADLTGLDKKYDDKVLVNSCLRHANEITKEPFTHESLLLDKKEYQLSEREKAMAFRNYNHDRKVFPLIKSNSTSLFYQELNHSSKIPNCKSDRLSNQNSNTSISYNLDDNSHKYESYIDFNLNKNLSKLFKHPQSNDKHSDSVQKNNANTNFDNYFKLESSSSQNNNLNYDLRDVKINSFIAPSKLVIATSSYSFKNNLQQPRTSSSLNSNDQFDNSVVIQPGQKVYILKTQKECYLRTPDKKFVALRNKNDEEPLAYT